MFRCKYRTMVAHGVVALALACVPAAHAWTSVAVQAPSARQGSGSRFPLLLGTSWYPEQWPESRWGADLDLMQQAHMHVVRIGEFAWSTMEPSQGEFQFEWLDRAIALAAQHHIAVVLGTPTAAPPAWLTYRYPDTLRVDEDGRRAEHGNREQFSFTSPRYRRFAARIAEEMARRYGHNPNVIGWQIDNEIGVPSFDASARQAFHRWLEKRYGTVANLDREWATQYGPQTYDAFEAIPLPAKGERSALMLDWKRFVTDTWISYLEGQIAVIRANSSPRQFITTNTMHWNAGFDQYRLHRHLDMAAWDDYVPDGNLDPVLNAAEHDLVRGYKGRNFWLMETQPGYVNWGPINVTLPRGVMREMAWQAVGHGADAVLYWQWRSSPNGQEEYHGSVLGADGLPNPVYPEIQQIGAEFERVGPALAGSTIQAPVAILQSYESRWAMDLQHTRNVDYVRRIAGLYRAVEPLAQAVDIVSPDAPLAGYKVVFAPALSVITTATAAHLLDYVRSGGSLILEPHSDLKAAYETHLSALQPDPLAAAQSHIHGKGTITWMDASLAPGRLRSSVRGTLENAGVHPILAGLPDGVELMQRSSTTRRVWIIINHNEVAASVDTHHPGMDLLTGKGDTTIVLPPHGVAVFALARPE